jgi:hypothetical protein
VKVGTVSSSLSSQEDIVGSSQMNSGTAGTEHRPNIWDKHTNNNLKSWNRKLKNVLDIPVNHVKKETGNVILQFFLHK